MSWRSCIFFLLQSFKMATAHVRQLSNSVLCPWSYQSMTCFLKCTMLQESIWGKECQVNSIIYMKSESSFVKDKSSYKCLLVETAKEQPGRFNSCRPVWLVRAKGWSLISEQQQQEKRLRSLGWEDRLEKEITTHPASFPEKSRGQRRRAGYTPKGCKEPDTTEQLSPNYVTDSEDTSLKTADCIPCPGGA